MLDFNRILVGIDVDEGTLPPPTRQAFDHAVRIAASCGAELLLLTVTDTSDIDTQSILEASHEVPHALEALQEVQQQLIREAGEQGVLAVAEVAHGRSWYEIIRVAMREKSDLVVVGTRDKGQAERVLFGSTCMKLLRKCPCPVWITRPDSDELVQTILAADDFSETGEMVLRLGVGMAQALHGRLLALHAAKIGHEGALLRTGTSDADVESRRIQIIKAAEDKLAGRLAHLDHRTVPGGTVIRVATGMPDLEIEEAVRQEHISLVVMGTLARTGLPGLLLGNTAERLLPLLTCSVLAIKPEGFVSPVPAQ